MIRLIEAGEEERFVRSVMVPFLEPPADDAGLEELRFYAANTETDRAWVEEDRGRFVANCAIDTMDLTVPGGATIPMAGVTAVGVHPTHRRRGLLTEMMRMMLDDARRRGEPVAGLLASESVIYGRFGFGHATDGEELRITPDRTAFIAPVEPAEVELVDAEEAGKLLPDLFDVCRRRRAGEPCRLPWRWERLLRDGSRVREGNRGAFVAVAADGFARYRMHANEDDLILEDLFGATDEAEARLWRFVFSLDLVKRVVAKRRPVDEPLRWRLADPRRLEVVSTEDLLYLRVLDVAAALEARRYYSSGRLVLDLLSPKSPEEPPGRWVLEAGLDGAGCRPAGPGDETDLRMEITALGSIYLGGFRPSVLAAAGRIEEVTAGSLARADALFAAPLAPRTSTGF